MAKVSLDPHDIPRNNSKSTIKTECKCTWASNWADDLQVFSAALNGALKLNLLRGKWLI